MVMVVIVMVMTVVMVVGVTMEMIVIVHKRISFDIFFLLYPGKRGLSKHLFLQKYPLGGLAEMAKMGYNQQKLTNEREGKTMDHEYQHHHHDHDHEHSHEYLHAHGIAHSHGHVHENQKAVINRLARAIGHLEKVKRMVEEGYDCSDVLVQLAAVRSAIDNTGKVILQDHMRHCMVDAVAAGDHDAIEDLCKAIEKYMK